MTDITDPEIRDNIRWLMNEESLLDAQIARIGGWSEDGQMSRQLRQIAFETVDKLAESRSYVIDLLDIISDYTWDDDPEEVENLEGASETRSIIRPAEPDPEAIHVEVVHTIETAFGLLRIAYPKEQR